MEIWLYPCRAHPVRIPFTIQYQITNILDLSLQRLSVGSSTVLVYMILNSIGKYGICRYSLVSFIF